MGLLSGAGWLFLAFLAHGIGIQGSAPPVYIGERHHEALAYWVQMINTGRLPFKKYTILHIDSHMDFAGGPKTFNGSDWPDSASQIMEKVDIGDFLSLAVWLGLSNDFIFLAPPWEMQTRQDRSELDMQVIVGEGEDGQLKFYLVNSKPPIKKGDLEGFFGSHIVNETGREKLRRVVQCRIRVLPAETAFDFLARGRLFEGQDHTRLLLDVDMDVLSTTSAGSQELTQHGMEEALLFRIHRLHTGFEEDLVSKFHRKATVPALLPNWTMVNRSVESVLLEFPLEPNSEPTERMDVVREKLTAVSERLQTTMDHFADLRRQRAMMALVDSKKEWIEALNPEGTAEIESCFEKSMEQPYQISSEQEITYLAAFWADFFSQLPVTPAAVTIVRSPSYTPLLTMRLQECTLLAAFLHAWPNAVLEAAEGFQPWHQNCSTDHGNVSSWRVHSTGILSDMIFSDVYETYTEWEHGIDAIAPLNCADDAEEDDDEDVDDPDMVSVRVENRCPAGGAISMSWHDANDSSEGALESIPCKGSSKFDSYVGHILRASCADNGQDGEMLQYKVQKYCTDSDEECEAWAADGECSNNPEYMHDECKKACLLCNTERNDDYGEEGEYVVWKVSLPDCGQNIAPTEL